LLQFAQPAMHNFLNVVVWTPEWEPFSVHSAQSLARLFTAAVLGAAVGLERELKHRPAGLRTNLFICFGSALFTILSDRLAGPDVADRTRIAAQIITGIGFIGAGTILHEKGSVSGLTSAATIFVVAGIGMAAGGGLYGTAIVATALVVLALIVLGQVEASFDLKPVIVSYQVIGTECDNSDRVLAAVNDALEHMGLSMQTVSMSVVNGQCRLQFVVEAYRSKQKELADRLKALPVVSTLAATAETDRD
jgi:putative Mg2+ transporter-C (MgtC) family protein